MRMSLQEILIIRRISEEDRIQLNIPMISWKNEPIKIELDIQAMVINQ